MSHGEPSYEKWGEIILKRKLTYSCRQLLNNKNDGLIHGFYFDIMDGWMVYTYPYYRFKRRISLLASQNVIKRCVRPENCMDCFSSARTFFGKQFTNDCGFLKSFLLFMSKVDISLDSIN